MEQPYIAAAPVTTSDTVDLLFGPCEALYVGGAGIVQAVLTNDKVVAFTCIAGQILPVKVKRVNATSTTATLMVALYRA